LNAAAMGLLSCGQAIRAESAPEELLEVEVKTLHVMNGTSPVVVLGPSDDSLFLPIWIGIGEAQAIARKLEHEAVPRPMTHDLVVNTISGLGARLDRVVVSHIADDTFYARLELSRDGQRFDIDARPSDAIAVALRLEAPIFVSRPVIDAVALKSPQTPGGVTRFGFKVQEMTEPLAASFELDEPHGVLVREVLAGGPASQGGLRVADVILAVDQIAVADLEGFSTMMESEEHARLTILRDGDSLELLLDAPEANTD
jgi:bifunctional DNase/RNase